MQEDLTLYFGSVAEALFVIAVAIASGVALMSGYTVLKNQHQRPYENSPMATQMNSFTSWLVIGVEIALAVHLISAVVSPNWITVGFTAAIALVQLALNHVIHTDVKAAYLT